MLVGLLILDMDALALRLNVIKAVVDKVDLTRRNLVSGEGVKNWFDETERWKGQRGEKKKIPSEMEVAPRYNC